MLQSHTLLAIATYGSLILNYKFCMAFRMAMITYVAPACLLKTFEDKLYMWIKIACP